MVNNANCIKLYNILFNNDFLKENKQIIDLEKKNNNNYINNLYLIAKSDIDEYCDRKLSSEYLLSKNNFVFVNKKNINKTLLINKISSIIALNAKTNPFISETTRNLLCKLTENKNTLEQFKLKFISGDTKFIENFLIEHSFDYLSDMDKKLLEEEIENIINFRIDIQTNSISDKLIDFNNKN